MLEPCLLQPCFHVAGPGAPRRAGPLPPCSAARPAGPSLRVYAVVFMFM